jgi:hypothetical protein
MGTGIRIGGSFGSGWGDSLLVTQCVLRNCTTGIYIGGLGPDVEGVKIERTTVQAIQYAVHVYHNYSVVLNSRKLKFVNCMFSSPVAVFLNEVSYIEFVNNSFYGSFLCWLDNSHIWFYNNCLVRDISQNGYLINLNSYSTFFADHNNYFAYNNSPLFSCDSTLNQPTDLISFAQFTGEDQNSLSVQPYYVSTTDLHSYSPDLKYRGVSRPDVAFDFDGELRQTMPDIGADEYHASPLPPHAFISQECVLQNNTIQFTDTSVRVANRIWDFGDNSPVSTSPAPLHTWAGSGPYTLMLIVQNQFGSDTAYQTINFVQNIPQLVSNGFQLSVTGGNYTQYQWNFNGMPINTATDSTYFAPFPGLYSVSVWESGVDCPYTTNDFLVSINEISSETSSLIYPNPASGDELYLTASSGLFDRVNVYSITGQLIASQLINQNVITIRDFQSGFYLLSFICDNKTVCVPLVIQR